MNNVGRRVTYVQLHTVIHLPLVGQLPSAISNQDPQNKGKDFVMTKTDTGILVDTGKRSFEIPLSNCMCYEYAPEAKQEVKATVKQAAE